MSVPETDRLSVGLTLWFNIQVSKWARPDRVAIGILHRSKRLVQSRLASENSSVPDWLHAGGSINRSEDNSPFFNSLNYSSKFGTLLLLVSGVKESEATAGGKSYRLVLWLAPDLTRALSSQAVGNKNKQNNYFLLKPEKVNSCIILSIALVHFLTQVDTVHIGHSSLLALDTLAAKPMNGNKSFHFKVRNVSNHSLIHRFSVSSPN